MMELLAGLVAEFPWGMNSELNFFRVLFGKVLYLFISVQFLWAQFYGDPPDKTHPWAVHDNNRPQPSRIEPGEILGSPPSDAIILFDGTKESFKANWKHEKHKRKKDIVTEEEKDSLFVDSETSEDISTQDKPNIFIQTNNKEQSLTLKKRRLEKD